ncbi:hypothetical protein [Kitasatospora fiedleri]|uniref:hypothetical protein n=1 Tax=Kitasatospora fiedleri TaxID=2991545 RepID=UPI00249BAB8F|nr:hypothetical protein [Kitasatospora fiedleri]
MVKTIGTTKPAIWTISEAVECPWPPWARTPSTTAVTAKAAVHTAVMITLTRMNGLSVQNSCGVVRLAMPSVNGLPISSEPPAITARTAEDSVAE